MLGLYRQYVLPHLVDRVLSGPGWEGWRQRTTEGLAGTVVEIGFGSGLNVPHYPPEVSVVYAVEPALRARRLAAPRVADSHAEVRHVGLDGARLPLPDDSCDGALSTFTLCTIPQVEQALAELRRVLRPGGVFHFLEHGVAPDASLARVQRVIEPAQKLLADGCHLTRDPRGLVERAGFTIVAEESSYAGTASPWTYLTLGVAESTAA
jgi:ubiquinone/menaquinone biosynthesis C-methylase UbiE